ncbi:hypothetical protein PHYBOEH_008663 [Phytophthora boehmeriae]|uniref:Uncharacterized protein n=1 Tax=Phytophthora boehmeriae TaxID=109152 RepID=A0A8T1X581_9STRA|nr:hypothetical protein PHYBOEH_008663 [Phytophthora boehmeriae]
MDTKESYSSNAEFDHLSSEQFFESGRSMSFSEPETEWTDTYSSSHGPPTFRSGITEPTSNTIVSLESSRSSLNNSQYASRDTEASEHIHESEDYIMFTNSSSEALSFDAGSTSPEF